MWMDVHKLRTSLWGYLLLIVAKICSSESVFEWGCSAPTNDSNVVYVPDIPTSLPDDLSNHELSVVDHLYVFEVPRSSLDCNGTVTGVEFCYRKFGANSIDTLFTLLVLNTSSTSMEFTVINIVPVPSPALTNNDCLPDGAICCTSYTFENDDIFELPSHNFALGIQIPRLAVDLLWNFESQYSVLGNVISPIPEHAIGSTINVSDSPSNLSLRIVKLVVAQTDIATVSTDPASFSPMNTGATSSPPMDTGATSSPQTGGDSHVPAAVGVVFGLGVPLTLLCVGVVVIVMCVRKSRREDWEPKQVLSSDKDLPCHGFENAVYGNDNDLPRDGIENVVYDSEAVITGKIKGASVKHTSPEEYDYASTDTRPVNRKRTDADLHEYATAEELGNPKRLASIPEYAYADTDTNLKVAKDPPQLPPSTGRRKSRQSVTDMNYMAPADDENSLYAQFSEIKITVLSHAAIDLKEKLGAGQFGTVHKAELKNGERSSQMVAVKTLNKGSNELDRVKFLQEAAIMGQFRHPNVVKLYGVALQEEPIMIVLELLLVGDLKNHLLKSKEIHSESIDVHTLLSYCRQIASGMAYLSGKAFVHRDLAARNILVSEDGVCKIADFGMSRDLMDETYYISHGGKIPVRWTAPEAIHYKKYSTASDVWSFGCVMYEIWSLGHKPFEAFSNTQTIGEVEEGYRLAPPPGTPRTLYKLMIECWHPLKSERPTFTELMQELSLPDTKLLKWSEEDKKVHPQACVLGAQLHYTEHLYPDLQSAYEVSKKTATVGSYEVPCIQHIQK